MKIFKDTVGTEWTIDVNVATAKRVKSMIGVDLLAIADGRVIEQLAGDPVMLVDVLYVLCKTQADERGISDEQFGERMAGDAIEHATHALLDAVADFFPTRQRVPLLKALAKIREMQTRALEQASQRVDEFVAMELPTLASPAASVQA